MKLAILIASFLLLCFGIIYKLANLVLVGAFCYILSLLFDLAQAIILSRKYKKGIVEGKNKSRLVGVSGLLQGSLILYGLIAIYIEHPKEIEISGQIIWFGSIAYYALVGIIVSELTGIPLTMTYGGWKAGYRKRKRRK
ncbi:hypothetical protein A4D02_23315 [Niastella koreensis]|uniref:Uncharacterized protein n=2 Tax=Niastella koreensis TaxID=354356 RepID=G8T9R9_NIAKG|nr:hypothetical protein [Niastella koreensis]AEW00262.1 hypothetical protein Niako_3979 [Niastella koreensis GR20-10]OQP52133.1 hypothetical protein A4D02_23315 [Niastella koreensis]